MLKNLLFLTVFSLTAIQLYCADEIVADAVDADHTVPVVVIGSGPAGLTSAVWTQRSGMKTIVLTGEQLGGQVSEISKIANWPGKKRNDRIRNDGRVTRTSKIVRCGIG